VFGIPCTTSTGITITPVYRFLAVLYQNPIG
jgi:hypothetical protein